MIVMKFGGTSVESAEAIDRGIGIVKSRLDRRPVVVVSAMGKTTNRLLKIANLAVTGQRDEALRELVSLRDYHLRESGMERTVEEHFQELTELVKGCFIAATEDGVTTTLGRGGSDFTASIVGAGIGAEEIQIWTDVDGMLTADPTILSGSHRVKIISFAEAAELAYFGAKVLHPATVIPAVEKNIPVLILNSRRPDVAGPRIGS